MKKQKRMLAMCLAAAVAVSMAVSACGGDTASSATASGAASGTASGTAATNADRETVNIRFAQYGNSVDDVAGMENDPVKKAI